MPKRARKDENIRVCVRARPLAAREQAGVEIDTIDGSVIIPSQGKTFSYDSCFDEKFEQEDIFNKELCPLVEYVLEGFNSTVFAYGQSGSGKTHTIAGYPGNPGMLPRVLQYLFKCLKNASNPKLENTVTVQFVEIYNEECKDLLADGATVKLKLTEDKAAFHLPDAFRSTVTNAEDAFALFEKGNTTRHVGETVLNPRSSRSHAVFMIKLDSFDPDEKKHVVSVFNLVDLAGSEKQNQSHAEGKRLMEGAKINQSLTILGMCIDAVTAGQYVPYRSSVLTQLLKCSLGGNSKTLMFAAIRRDAQFVLETLSTLDFAKRVKKVKNTPKKNLDPKDAIIESLRADVEELTEKIRKLNGGEDNSEEIEERYRQQLADLQLEKREQKEALEAEIGKLHAQISELEAAMGAGSHRSSISGPQIIKEVVKEVIVDKDGNQQVVDKVVETVIPGHSMIQSTAQAVTAAQELQEITDQKEEMVNLVSGFIRSGFLWLQQSVDKLANFDLPEVDFDVPLDYSTTSDCLKVLETGMGQVSIMREKQAEKYEMKQNTVLAELNTMKDDLDKNLQENEWLQQQVESKQAEVDKMAEEAKNLKRSINDIKDEKSQELQELKREFMQNEEHLRTEMGKLGQQIGDLTRQARADKKSLKRYADEANSMKSENEKREQFWKAEVDRKQRYWETERDQFNLQISAMQGEAENQHAEVVNLFATQMGVQSKLQQSHERELSKLATLMDSFKSLSKAETEKYINALRNVESELEIANKEKKQVMTQHEQSVATVRDLQRELKDFSNTNAELASQNSQLSQMLDEQDASISELKNSFAAQLATVRNEGKKTQKELKHNVRELQQELTAAQAESQKLAQSEQTVAMLTAQKQRLADELQSKIGAVDAIRLTLKQTRAMNEKVVDEWKEKYNFALEEQQDLQSKANHKEKKLTKYYEQLLQENTVHWKQQLHEAAMTFHNEKEEIQKQAKLREAALWAEKEEANTLYDQQVTAANEMSELLGKEKEQTLRAMMDEGRKQAADAQNTLDKALQQSRDRRSRMPMWPRA
eukprot:TRINITY_DN62974_c0_g1_i1.p1 TRINITY_DN62974_c0_g1~~TRINITY_DN62974_c0_g1_i1.p1  ORF type:complete len:1046 (+),score=189.78 TRINITY_DN62974_c0_g1_i1:69-3206(+)